ncbi:hypothetical protein TNCT_733451 [Trichonephila clavata]|uniref:Secreted protein n=1 Tax=Trichonephila clavata TaxID=2740835 RepID=A0A8X6H6Y7_TRICU|nr:hypothetical protein TNCT_733451 [Trichonephila clavata]
MVVNCSFIVLSVSPLLSYVSAKHSEVRGSIRGSLNSLDSDESYFEMLCYQQILVMQLTKIKGIRMKQCWWNYCKRDAPGSLGVRTGDSFPSEQHKPSVPTTKSRKKLKDTSHLR